MQHKADEKKAFEDMMAEIDSDDNDSDLDEGISFRQVRAASPRVYLTSSNRPTQIAEQKIHDRRISTAQIVKMTKEEEEIENFGLPEYGGVGGSHVTRRDVSMGRSHNGTSQAKGQASPRATNDLSGSNTVDGALMAQEQLNITKRWLLRPCSINDRHSMKCYVERERSSFGMNTVYRCFFESNQGNTSSSGESASIELGEQSGNSSGTGRFMMSAKKKVVNKTSYYLISLDFNPSDDRGSETVLGKVRGNSIGSRYIVTDGGLPPDKTVAPSMLRKELGVTAFEFDSGGPSRIESWVPYVSTGGAQAIWQPTSESETMEYYIDNVLNASTASAAPSNGSVTVCQPPVAESKIIGKHVQTHESTQQFRLYHLQNKTPKWDEAHGGHVLNFQGRVTESSVKNFQLVCTDSSYYADLAETGIFGGNSASRNGTVIDYASMEDVVVLQFGRVGKHKFNMDLRYPLSPLQAFSICVACLDGKIADRKGYEYIKKLTGTAADLGDTSGGNYCRDIASTGASIESNVDTVNVGANSRQGNMSGNSGLSGIVKERLPSGQYLKDKFKRTFK